AKAAVGQAERRSAVSGPDEDTVLAPVALATLDERNQLRRRGHREAGRIVEPRQAPLGLFPERSEANLAAQRNRGEERSAIGRDGVEQQSGGRAVEQTFAAVEGHGPHAAQHADACSREPDLTSAGRPRKSLHAQPAGRERTRLPRPFHHAYLAIVALVDVRDEGQAFAVRRQTRIAEPVRRMQSIRASDADRMLIATRSLPSGDQSAEFMPSASSRAAPPEIEARASVPVGLKTMPWWRALTSSAMSPAGEIDSTSAGGRGSGLE